MDDNTVTTSNTTNFEDEYSEPISTSPIVDDSISKRLKKMKRKEK